MKAIMISKHPKECFLIANGEKTIEIRKTQLKTPFKCYIYCTKQNGNFVARAYGSKIWLGMGKVIGEFVCDRIDKMLPDYNPCTKQFFYNNDWCNNDWSSEDTCLSTEELNDYGKGKPLYGWHISDLKIYDEPKELSMFRYPYDYDGEGFIKCNYDICPHVDYKGHWKYDCVKECPDLRKQYEITRPPQSWCYVEESV